MSSCSCDFEPAVFYRARIVSARKRHKCEECCGDILPGDKYEYVSAKWDYGIDTFHTCSRCVDLRTWVQNNVPCLCWMHGNADESMEEAIEDARDRAPLETTGLRFGFLRRKILRDRFYRARAADRAAA